MSASEALAVAGGSAVRDELLPLIRASVGERERQQVQSVFEAGVFCSVLPAATKVKALEAAFARSAGAKHAVAFSSGTTAQHASIRACGIGPGDEVIVPPLTFISTAYTVLIEGATVVFADVDDDTLNLDPARVAEKITARTRAIVPVHWLGRPADMDPLLALAATHDVHTIEDCAHAYGVTCGGRKAGTMGAMACWSLQESKLITAAGEGGMLTTDRDDLAARVRSIRDHGKDQADRPGCIGYSVVTIGNNYRMTEMQAAFALAQLERIDELLARRRAHSEYLDAALDDLPGLRRPGIAADTTSSGTSVSHPYYAVRFESDHFGVELGQISAALEAEGIGNYAMGSDELCHVHPIFAERPAPGGQSCRPGTLPVAERIARELLLLPLYPDLGREDLDDIIAAVGKVARAYDGRA